MRYCVNVYNQLFTVEAKNKSEAREKGLEEYFNMVLKDNSNVNILVKEYEDGNASKSNTESKEDPK
jgi:hypothetical protein